MINNSNEELDFIANRLRRIMFEYMIPDKIYHIGGDLSCVEILVYIFYHCIKGKNLYDKNRDNFILSKGHNVYTLYTIFADLGYYDYSYLSTFKTFKSPLQGHPDCRKMKLLDFSTGSLGQGLSAGVGMALANRIHKENGIVYVLLGDGELEEGQNWEAAISGTKYGLDNLIAIVDYNSLQVDGSTKEYFEDAEGLKDRWDAFGWGSILINDGHDFKDIAIAMNKALIKNNKPKIIIAKTIKGKGISFMENVKSWHSCRIDNRTKEKCLEELSNDNI